jgi:hypothetical protein
VATIAISILPCATDGAAKDVAAPATAAPVKNLRLSINFLLKK